FEVDVALVFHPSFQHYRSGFPKALLGLEFGYLTALFDIPGHTNQYQRSGFLADGCTRGINGYRLGVNYNRAKVSARLGVSRYVDGEIKGLRTAGRYNRLLGLYAYPAS